MPLRPSLLLLLLAAPCGLVACGDPPPEGAVAWTGAPVWRERVAPVLARYCVRCHGGAHPEASLSFATWATAGGAPQPGALRARTEVLERMAHHVEAGLMPPAGEPRPPVPTRATFVASLRSTLAAAWRLAPPDPGRVTVRRLNRSEYRNTVRDLLGVDVDTAAVFPPDDVGYGFDDVGDVLSMAPMLLEKYLDVAEDVAERALPPAEGVRRFEAEAMTPAGGSRRDGHGLMFFTAGEARRDVTFPRTASYRLRVVVRPQQAGPDPARVRLRLDGHTVLERPVDAPSGAQRTLEARVKVEAGRHLLAVGFPNDYWRPEDPDPAQRDRNLWVDAVEVEGPRAPAGGPPQGQAGLLACAPKAGDEGACARDVLGRLLLHAFRRPPTARERARYLGLFERARARGEDFAGALRVALEAVLVAPQFLFRLELDERGSGGRVRPLTDYELASRLSYFLWSSCPDGALLAEARAGTLRADLDFEVTRMLADPRSRSLVTDFAAQWLELRRLDTVAPDPKRFPDFDDGLRAAMRTETQMFVSAIVREDRSILDLLDAPFTYVNGPLARHYGIPGVEGPAFRRVALSDGHRGGLLGQASILTLTSHPTRTSPVLRGKYVLQEILGAPPPPPPPGVGTLEAQDAAVRKLPLRERLARHRRDPSCAVCHERMDNLGYALEGFDAVGAWRTTEAGAPVDAHGRLPDGRQVDGPASLRRLLRADPGFPRCFAGKLLTFALGRGLRPEDRRAVRRIVRAARAQDLRFSAFVRAVVASDAFRLRRCSGDTP